MFVTDFIINFHNSETYQVNVIIKLYFININSESEEKMQYYLYKLCFNLQEIITLYIELQTL